MDSKTNKTMDYSTGKKEESPFVGTTLSRTPEKPTIKITRASEPRKTTRSKREDGNPAVGATSESQAEDVDSAYDVLKDLGRLQDATNLEATSDASSQAETQEGKKRKRIHSQNGDTAPEGDQEKEKEPRISREQAVMDTNTLGTNVLQWIAEVEECRSRSKNLQGAISGQMRARLIKIREATLSLIDRASSNIDVAYVNQLKEDKERLSRSNEIIGKENYRLQHMLSSARKTRARGTSSESEAQAGTEFRRNKKSYGSKKPGDTMEVKSASPPTRRDKQTSEDIKQLKSEISVIKELLINVQNGNSHNKDRLEIPAQNLRRLSMREKGKTPKVISQGEKQETSEKGTEKSTDLSDNSTNRDKDTGWTQVARSNKNRDTTATNKQRTKPPKEDKQDKSRRPPRSAAITIVKRDKEETFAEIIKRARENISLKELNIEATKVRHTASGNLLIEMSGEGNKEKADGLADKLRNVFEDRVIIRRPEKMGELVLSGLEMSVTPGDIMDQITLIGNCNPQEVTLGRINVNNRGQGIVWAKCPLAAAVEIVNSNKVVIGWTKPRIKLLQAKRLQCFKCLEFGHVKASCKSTTDKSDTCYRCGEDGHHSKTCKGKLKCYVCHSRGEPSNHRMGGDNCQGNQNSAKKSRRERRPLGEQAVEQEKSQHD